MTEKQQPRKLTAGIRILIVDDHAAIREGLCLLLSREPGFEVCGHAGTIAAALEIVRDKAPSIAIVDISLGVECGLDLIRRIAEIDSNTRVLAWSMHDDLLYAERALGAGAMGYINKRESTRKVVEAIRAIRDGDVYLCEDMKNRMLYRSIGSRSSNKKTPMEMLSNRELEVFRMIGNGMTTSEISKSLHLSTKTTDTHRHRIKLKLQLDDANKLIREATLWVLENG